MSNENNNTELDRLFQRVNFFLIGTAFLITAFARVITYYDTLTKPGFEIMALANGINAVGFYLAVFFTVTNYWNAVIIRKMGKRKHQPDYTMRSLLKEMSEDLGSLIKKPFDISKGHPAPHAWLVPMGFCIFWLLIWFLVLPYNWIPIVFGIAIPFIYFTVMVMKQKVGTTAHRKNMSAIAVIAGSLAISSGGIKILGILALIITSIFIMPVFGLHTITVLLTISIPLAILGTLSIVGGVFAIKRKKFGFALTGSITAFLPFSLLGLASIILLAISKVEFK